MKKIAIFCLLLSTAFLVGAPQENGTWPQWRGPAMDGKVIDKSFNFKEGMEFNISWKKAFGSGYSSLSIANQKVFGMASLGTADYMVALDAKDGHELWRYKIDASYIGHDGSHDGTISSPAVDEKYVYGLGPNGHLFCLSVENGKRIWQISLKEMGSVEPDYGWSTSPLIYKNSLVCEIGVKGKAFAAFNKLSGELIWTYGEDGISYQSPMFAKVHGQTQLLVVGAQTVQGLNPETGKPIWNFEHKGGGQDGTPIPMGENTFFLEHAFSESLAFSVNKTENGFEAVELWRTKDLKNTNNPSIYHKGFLYGYSGPFLTCVDASTGKRTWRSRKPGDGFLAAVNDYMIVITKRGVLHLASFNSVKYDDLTELEVFDSLGWNPPSFAYGKIFVRNLKEIACVTLSKGSQVASIPQEPKKDTTRGKIKGSRFASFIEKVDASDEKQKLIDAFMGEQKSFPIIEDNKLVHFIYRGKVEDIAITGDPFFLGENIPLNQVKDTQLYYFSMEFKSDAQMSYVFLKDYENRIPDPMNPLKVPSFQGEMSELRMPLWKDSPHLVEGSGPKGTLDSFEFESKIMKNKRQIEVYLPPGYEKSQQTYPVLFVHYGNMAVTMAKLPTSMDNLIGQTVAPGIIIFIGLNKENSYREVAGEFKEAYAQMIAEELVPNIENRYRTKKSQSSRAILGHSSGGFISLFTALKHPGVFNWAGGLSTNVEGALGEEMKKVIEESPKVGTQFFLDWGSYDSRSEDGEQNRHKVNQALFDQLKAKGYKVTGGQTNHGYGWGSWRTLNDTFLELFFPKEESKTIPE